MVISFFGVPAGTFPIPVIKAVIKACFVKPVKDQQMQSLSLRKWILLYTGVIPLLFFFRLKRELNFRWHYQTGLKNTSETYFLLFCGVAGT